MRAGILASQGRDSLGAVNRAAAELERRISGSPIATFNAPNFAPISDLQRVMQFVDRGVESGSPETMVSNHLSEVQVIVSTKKINAAGGIDGGLHKWSRKLTCCARRQDQALGGVQTQSCRCIVVAMELVGGQHRLQALDRLFSF